MTPVESTGGDSALLGVACNLNRDLSKGSSVGLELCSKESEITKVSIGVGPLTYRFEAKFSLEVALDSSSRALFLRTSSTRPPATKLSYALLASLLEF